MFIIADLDGTLALIDHRRHFVTGGRRSWGKFFAACGADTPHWPVIDTIKALMAQNTHRIEIWSGRSASVEHETKVWLQNVGLASLPLKMRPKNDNTADDLLKEQWLLAEAQKPDLIFDDRDRVVAMWRRHGIVCAQVAPGDF